MRITLPFLSRGMTQHLQQGGNDHRKEYKSKEESFNFGEKKVTNLCFDVLHLHGEVSNWRPGDGKRPILRENGRAAEG